MPRKFSSIAPDWWDYTTLDDALIEDEARLPPETIAGLSREGFKVVFYDTLEEFHLAEALEYITAWRQSTPESPVGICGPIGPTEQLPLGARLVTVTDRGRGIPAGFRRRIFEKFDQVEAHREGQRHSTGLGLTFCKLAVEATGADRR